MSAPEKTEEQKLRSKRVHAGVMMLLGAIMSVCALAAGLIALSPGAFPGCMAGGRGDKRGLRPAAFRAPSPSRVPFATFDDFARARARAGHGLILLHLAPSWSLEARLMEEAVYADAAAAAFIRARLVPVRADADERPDLAARYGVGAWPATLLLLPDGRAVAAASRLTPKLFLPWARLIDESLRADPAKADALAADAERRFDAVRRLPARVPGPDDPVWGGAYRSADEFAKTLSDQAALLRSSDSARGRAALSFVDRFLSLRGGGYAASMAGEVRLANGRIEEGFSYFAKDDAARRAAGLPELDRRLFAGPNAEMAGAVLRSPLATGAQKQYARRTLDLLWTRLVKNGLVSRTPGGIKGWPEDQAALADAEKAAGRPQRAKKLLAAVR